MKIIVFLLIRFLGKISAHIKHPLKIHVLLNDLYHKVVFAYLLRYFNKTYNICNSFNNTSNNNSGIIWIFWWQGKQQMPLIIQCCIRSIKKHANGHRVILITKDNIENYSNIPKYIYKKFKKHQISLAHFSDILRFELLNNYGGLWIDSTMYCTSDLGTNYFDEFYTSGPGGKDVNRYHDFVSDKWTEFLIGGCEHNPIFEFLYKFLIIYWKENNYALDYFLADYALYYVYLYNIGGFSDYVDNVAKNNNPHLHTLMNYLNDSFNADKYNKMISDTDLFKLTYKVKFIYGGTFYRKIVKGNNYNGESACNEK